MTNLIKNICVYSSSSNQLENKFFDDAKALGMLMGQNGFNLVYGGGTLGTMYANAKAVKEFGGKVIGIIPEKLYEVGVSNPYCDELIVTKCMRTRKERLDNMADAAIALAGGYGTLEELSEMIVQKQLGYNNKAIVILNTDGFYDNLVAFFDRLIKQNFALENSRKIYYVAKSPEDAIIYLKNYIPENFNVYEKLNIEEKVQ